MRVLTIIRLADGALLAIGPQRLRDMAGLATGGEIAVARILGLRQLLQAWLTEADFGAPALRVGALVDTLHALSMVLLAFASRRRRRAAQLSAGTAGGFALAGWWCAHRVDQPAAPSDQRSA